MDIDPINHGPFTFGRNGFIQIQLRSNKFEVKLRDRLGFCKDVGVINHNDPNLNETLKKKKIIKNGLTLFINEDENKVFILYIKTL